MGINDLVGNQRVKLVLSGYLLKDAIPDSLIFAGPGSADTLGFALGFAKAINCTEMAGDFCDSCVSCTEINRNISPDLTILSPDGQFYRKEQISFLIEDNLKRPLVGDRKIYILKDAHRMNDYSANAFLKALEEPASTSVFILLTSNLNGLLPTIRSRCQELHFSPLLRAEIKKSLTDQGYDEEKARLVSYLAQGTMERIMDMDFDEYMEKREGGISVLTKLINRDGVEDVLLDLTYRGRNRGQFLLYFRDLVNLLSLMLRDIMILKIDSDNPNLINVDYGESLQALTEKVSVEKILFLIRRMEYILRDIQRNLNTKVLILEFIRSYTT